MVELVSNGTNSNTVQTCQIFWIVKNSIKIIAICSQSMNELLVANYLDRMIVPKDFLSRKESVVG
jgi:hypothetical protein